MSEMPADLISTDRHWIVAAAIGAIAGDTPKHNHAATMRSLPSTTSTV
jgi:hypothetical protein